MTTGTAVAPVAVLSAAQAAGLPADSVVAALRSDALAGLADPEAARRLAELGPNALRDHRVRAVGVLLRQLKSPLLVLLMVTAAASFAVGERTDAGIVAAILAAGAGLGFANEYRAERASEALHARVHRTAVAVRDGTPRRIDAVELVSGDVVQLGIGTVVPADLRLLDTAGLACDESVLTGESLPAAKQAGPVEQAALAELTCIAFMGTVVQAGSGLGIVVTTGAATEFGKIASGLGRRQPDTDFQIGLRRFSLLLLRVAAVLTAFILLVNLLLHRAPLDSMLFALAIAVGVTPQLLPAVVSTSLAAGSRQLARRKVLVKRLVAIEDLGDMGILVTDKTGTLTEGRISFVRAVDAAGQDDDQPRRLGLLATGGSAAAGSALDDALRDSTHVPPAGYSRLASAPFDHQRRMASALVRGPDGEHVLVVKGAPEAVLAACADVPEPAQTTLHALFAAGSRVVAVATRPMPGRSSAGTADEHDLTLAGYLVFLDPPKASAAASLQRLADLGIQVKVATGDNPRVAEKLWTDLGRPAPRTLTGPQLDALDDIRLSIVVGRVDIFARVSPEHKARLIRALRSEGRAIGFLGDGVNDALALHDADVGISVDSAADVAKDAADIVLLDKSLDVLADGVNQGRRIFANTIKYVLMGTASNFGNMFSAAAASAVLPFLPLLPSQILLGNLLYDSSQLALPTDRVDPEQLAAPSHWDIGLIRRFMLLFGPISSLFDFATFGILLGPLHVRTDVFRASWFVESLATQTLIVFAVRTRRVPFLRSRASGALIVAALTVVTIGAALPLSPIAATLGFAAPPARFYLVLVALVVAYLGLVEIVKKRFFTPPQPSTGRRRTQDHRIHRRAAGFTSSTRA